MVNNTNNVWRLLWNLIHEWFHATFLHLFIVHTILIFRKDNNNEPGKVESLKTF